MKVFRVAVTVFLTPSHPLYGEMEYGYLQVFILAASEEDAESRARRIVRELPYQVVQLIVYFDDKPWGPERAQLCAKEAMGVGVVLLLFPAEVIADSLTKISPEIHG